MSKGLEDYLVKQVLIGYHSQCMKQLLRTIVENSGYKIAAEVNNGSEVMDLYKKLKPDIVIIDVKIPDIDAIELIHKIKNYDQSARIIIIASSDHDVVVKEAILAGAIGYIVKTNT